MTNKAIFEKITFNVKTAVATFGKCGQLFIPTFGHTVFASNLYSRQSIFKALISHR